MKKLFHNLALFLLICALMFAAVGCNRSQDDGNVNENEGGGDVEQPVIVTKDALNAEISLEVTEQGDYTEASYNAYLEKLAVAKAVLADESATQESVDKAAADLTAARNGLKVRPISAVENTNKEIKLIPGSVREITLADYINDNNLSKVTYEVSSNNDAVLVSAIVDGKFTITAADVSDYVDAKVAIVVSYDGALKLEIEFSVKITNDIAPVLKNNEVVKNLDVFALANKESLVLDFAENVNNAGALELSYSVKCGEDTLTLDGATYTLALGEYGDDYTYVTYIVTVSYVANGKNGSLEYTFKLGLKDTTAYNVVNGNFENGLEGWTASESFGSIKDNSTFWDQNFPMFNVGKYFSSEGAEGTLASSYFVANSKYATFMIGAAAKENVYVSIEDASGNVLAIYRNIKFADLPAGVEDWNEQRQLIGVSVFVCNFVTYKVDISAYEGQSIRFVIHDHEDDGGFGFIYFDELNTYYVSEDLVPENAVLAENLLADKAALKAELALEVTEQGDYTADSYNVYLAKLAAAKALLDNVAVPQAKVDAATAALAEAYAALEVRPVLEVEDANKSFRLFSGNAQEITIADYVNENGLTKLTYAAQSSSAALRLSAISNGKFTITAGEVSEATVVTVSIIVSYDGIEKLAVELSIEITNDVAPTVYNAEVVKSYDVYELENKTNIVIDLANNVDNAGNLELTYSVNGVALDGSVYTFTLGNYNDKATNEVLNVTVAYVANGESQTISYTYTLAMKDSTAYRLENGGFENGLDGWTVVGNIGSVDGATHYWVGDGIFPEGYAFGMDGEKMFSAYAPGASEGAVGTLTSPSFKVGGSGYITFKVGGMKDGNYVYIDVVDANTKEILARYYNGNFSDVEGSNVRGCTLVAYRADLSDFMGREVFIRISDNADSGYGLFFVDSFVTYYDGMPHDFNDATPVSYTVSGTIYDLFNGGFEMGDVQGWWNQGEIGRVTGADGFFNENVPYGKDGAYLFSGVQNHGEDFNFERNTGILTSSVFEIGGSGYITYMLGGGNNICYVQVIDSTTGEILARYRQQAREDAKLIKYVADLSAYVGRSVRIQVVDNAIDGWGCVSFDAVKTYYASKPDGFIDAVDVKYELVNGSFENGMDGWKQNIWEHGAQGTLGWVESSEHDAGWYTKNDDRKDGNNIFTFCRPDGTNCENTKGELVSSSFVLKKDSYVSFRFGGAGTREVWIELVKANGEVIARFYNEAPGKQNTEMFAYYYQYTGEETECFFRVVDDSTGNYGCFVVDDFRVNLESAPEGFMAAIQ